MTNFTEEEISFIKFNFTGYNWKYIVEIFEDKFGKKVTTRQIREVYYNEDKKASVVNSGLCTYRINGEDTLFRRINRGEIPDEIYEKLIPFRFNRSDDNGRYNYLILVRESYYQWFLSGRELGSDYVLFHRDGDKMNCDVENLIPIPRNIKQKFARSWDRYRYLSHEAQNVIVKFGEVEEVMRGKK